MTILITTGLKKIGKGEKNENRSEFYKKFIWYNISYQKVNITKEKCDGISAKLKEGNVII